mmetsp:Transcript_142488/g.318802  ORF Transcript_142488/g.318802 Transcript_142488/m.318802 type:complete len:212 (-) Transcript_142488:139-774(-)
MLLQIGRIQSVRQGQCRPPDVELGCPLPGLVDNELVSLVSIFKTGHRPVGLHPQHLPDVGREQPDGLPSLHLTGGGTGLDLPPVPVQGGGGGRAVAVKEVAISGENTDRVVKTERAGAAGVVVVHGGQVEVGVGVSEVVMPGVGGAVAGLHFQGLLVRPGHAQVLRIPRHLQSDKIVGLNSDVGHPGMQLTPERIGQQGLVVVESHVARPK